MVTRLVFCFIAVLVGGCGDDPSREGGARKTTSPSRPAPQTITEAASGQSFTLALGSDARLRLSGEYDWSEPTVRGDAIELTRVDYFDDPGFREWTVLAVRPGTATIAADGTPACAGLERCPEAPLALEIKITVAP